MALMKPARRAPGDTDLRRSLSLTWILAPGFLAGLAFLSSAGAGAGCSPTTTLVRMWVRAAVLRRLRFRRGKAAIAGAVGGARRGGVRRHRSVISRIRKQPPSPPVRLAQRFSMGREEARGIISFSR